MATVEMQPVYLRPSPFDFNSCIRNAALAKSTGGALPKAMKTGTTIVAAVFKDGVVMAADSRATSGNFIADMKCQKLNKLANNIYAAGAGTAADLDQVVRMLAADMTLLALSTGRKPRVAAATRIAKQHMFKYQGHVGAYLLIGGVDFYGAKLVNVSAYGCTSIAPFEADGSGSIAAMAILETEYKIDMTEEECVDVVKKAVENGMHADLNSGNSYNVVVIDKDGARFTPGIVPDWCRKEEKVLDYKQKLAQKMILKSKEKKFEIVESMEIDH